MKLINSIKNKLNNIQNKPFITCITLALISMKSLSTVLMTLSLLLSAILAMDGYKKHAIYTSILSLICGVFGILMGNFVASLKDKLEMITAYPSLVDNPKVITQLHSFFNIMQGIQFATIFLFIVANIFIVRYFKA